jgi:hypothetical protein
MTTGSTTVEFSGDIHPCRAFSTSPSGARELACVLRSSGVVSGVISG